MPLSREQYKKCFLEFDTSGDGKLSFGEFKNHLSKILHVNVSDMAAKGVFNCVNKSNDSYISLDEWLDSLDRKSVKDIGKDDLKEVFKKVDINGNGTINFLELSKLLKSLNCTLSQGEVKKFFDRVDSSDDGAIGFNEFADEFFKDV